LLIAPKLPPIAAIRTDTTVVDAGTSGWKNSDFKSQVIDRSDNACAGLLNIAASAILQMTGGYDRNGMSR